MSIKLDLGQVKEIYKPSLYTGAGLIRIARDAKGNLVINANRAELSEVLPNVATEGEEFEYGKEIELERGYTDFQSNGGLKRMPEKDFKALDFQAQVLASGPEKVKMSRISLVVKSEIEKTVEGKTTVDPLFDVLAFSFLSAPRFSNDGKKCQMYNAYGKTCWVESDKVFPKDFDTTKGVWPAPDSFGDMGLEEFVNFVYSYSAVANNVPLFGPDGIDIQAILNGDYSSFEEVIEHVEKSRTIKHTDGKLYEFFGAIALAAPKQSNGTGGMIRQGFYPRFAQGIDGSADPNKFKHSVNTTFSPILNDIAKSRKPNKDAKIYSPESKGMFIAKVGNPTYGFKSITEEEVREALAAFGAVSNAMPTAIRTNAGAAAVNGIADDPFGV